MKPQYNLDTIEKIKALAAQGLTRADIRLAVNLPFDDIDYLVNFLEIPVRHGNCGVAKKTRKWPVKDKIKYLFQHHPNLELAQTEIARCAGMRNNLGASNATKETLSQLVDEGFLDVNTRNGRYLFYRLAGQTPAGSNEQAKSEVNELDFSRCDDLYAIKTLLAEILRQLKALNERKPQ